MFKIFAPFYHAKRLLVIIFIIARYRIFFPLERMGIPIFIYGFLYLIPSPYRKLRPGERLAQAFEKLGPTFIKFGQALSTRSDIVGDDIVADLSRLQDKLPPFDFAKVQQTIEDELHQPINKLFKHIDKHPIAAASIAQVHHAVTTDGQEVGVKILRPKVHELLHRDLSLFAFGARILEFFLKEARRLRAKEIIATFAHSVDIEMDLRLEGASASEIANNLRNDPNILIPKIYWHLSSKQILTMEWMEGIPINNKQKLIENNIDLRAVVSHLAISFFNQAYRDGFFHADVHPGNILVNKEGKLILVDFGIMGRLAKKDRIFVAEILRGFIRHDYMHVANIHKEAGYIPSDTDLGEFSLACRAIGEPIVGLSASKISVGKLLGHLFSITRKFNMKTQPQLLLLQKTTLLLEGVGAQVYSEANLWKLAEPWIEDWAILNLGIEAHINEKISQLGSIVDHIYTRLQDNKDSYIIVPQKSNANNMAWLTYGIILGGAFISMLFYLIG